MKSLEFSAGQIDAVTKLHQETAQKYCKRSAWSYRE